VEARERSPSWTRALLASCLAAGLGCGAGPSPEAPPPPATSRDGRWAQDIDYLADQLARLHPNLFFRTPRADFDRAVDEAKRALPSQQEHEVAVSLLRLIALPGDAHTSLAFPASFHQLPVRFSRFPDGLYVVEAEASLAHALGTRVVAIGDRTVEEAAEAVQPLVPHENTAWLAVRAPAFLAVPEILHALRITSDTTSVRLLLEDERGARFPMEARAASAPTLLDLTASAGFPLPLHRQRRNENYWFAPLAEAGALYLQYNRCQNGTEPFAAFAERLFRDLDRDPSLRLVVDVRHNPGGDSNVDDPLFRGLDARAARFTRGRLFGLIGGETFSSGMWTADDLRRRGAVMVGTPTGGKPNSYGNVRNFFLRNSGLQAFYSTTFYRLIEGADPPSVMPDLRVEPSIRDYREGRDPLLEAALDYRAP
jgi:hypothetical protein